MIPFLLVYFIFQCFFFLKNSFQYRYDSNIHDCTLMMRCLFTYHSLNWTTVILHTHTCTRHIHSSLELSTQGFHVITRTAMVAAFTTAGMESFSWSLICWEVKIERYSKNEILQHCFVKKKNHKMLTMYCECGRHIEL